MAEGRSGGKGARGGVLGGAGPILGRFAGGKWGGIDIVILVPRNSFF